MAGEGDINDNVNPEQRRIVNENLLAAVDKYDTDIVNLCLQKGADINARNGDGRTPLMIAVWKDNPSLVRFILSKQPDLFAKDNSGETAYDLIKRVNNADTRRNITVIMLQALPNAPPLRDLTLDDVIVLAEKEAVKAQAAAKERVAALKTGGSGNKPASRPPKPFSI